MNGARRGAPWAGAFGALRPPPPPGSQFTPSSFFYTQISMAAKLFCEFHGECIIIIIAHGESDEGMTVGLLGNFLWCL